MSRWQSIQVFADGLMEGSLGLDDFEPFMLESEGKPDGRDWEGLYNYLSYLHGGTGDIDQDMKKAIKRPFEYGPMTGPSIARALLYGEKLIVIATPDGVPEGERPFRGAVLPTETRWPIRFFATHPSANLNWRWQRVLIDLMSPGRIRALTRSNLVNPGSMAIDILERHVRDLYEAHLGKLLIVTGLLTSEYFDVDLSQPALVKVLPTGDDEVLHMPLDADMQPESVSSFWHVRLAFPHPDIDEEEEYYILDAGNFYPDGDVYHNNQWRLVEREELGP
jgi:hypothetical protein